MDDGDESADGELTESNSINKYLSTIISCRELRYFVYNATI